jgi:hypothetical protein
MSDDTPQGQRFSHLYLARGEPTSDSAKMRRRLASIVRYTYGQHGLAAEIEKEVGLRPSYRAHGVEWDALFEGCALVNLLDVVTVTWQFLTKQHPQIAGGWPEDVQRIFTEENVRYRVDARGGVHFSIDEEFERSRIASVAVLQSPRYSNVLNQFEKAYTELATEPPNGKEAIRAIFTAAEGLFRVMFETSPRLTGAEIEKNLVPFIRATSVGDITASGALGKLTRGFREWVDAAHFYRHEPGEEKIAQPPLTFAIVMVSSGASYIRWLAELDAQDK